MDKPSANPIDFTQVLAEEHAALRKEGGDPARLLGLAFSGGGIRSATFNLGVLQSLARLRLLRHVDYLSTVSGGGYIGAWFAALLARSDGGICKVEEMLSSPGADQPEPSAVRWLRRFSNYLTPKTGLTLDTLTGVASYVRNLLLNLTGLLALFALLLLLPRILTALVGRWEVSWSLAIALPVLFIAGTGAIAGVLRARRADARGALSPAASMLLLLLGSVLLTPAMRQLDAWFFLALGLGSYVIAWLVEVLTVPSRDATRWHLLHALASGALAGGLLALGRGFAACVELSAHEAMLLAPPYIMTCYALGLVLHVGLAKRRFDEMQREWLSRFGAQLIRASVLWLLLVGIAFAAAPAFEYLGAWIAGMGGLGWAGATLWGVLAGKSSGTGEQGASGRKETLLKIVPWIFILGLLGLIGVGVQQALLPGGEPFSPRSEAPAPGALSVSILGSAGQEARIDMTPPTRTEPAGWPAWRGHAQRLLEQAETFKLVCALGILMLIIYVSGKRIDINLFSFHNFYRHRLTRCYLGASNPDRKASPFTGLDEGDDLPVAELARRPYHLFNVALNLAGASELAWQERKAANFTIAPLFAGFTLPEGMGETRGAYRRTDRLLADDAPGGMRVGTAVAISGAAVNPNMGYHSSPAVSFLLALFNVRLGRWCGNPLADEAVWRESSPAFGLSYMLKELAGDTSETQDWLNLSDGGHFENLALYELVRRRCRYVVVVDAAQDEGYAFGDLANAQRKIRADLGIDIDIDVDDLRPKDGKQRAHAALGRIRYDRIDPSLEPGYLLYLRPGLTGKEPEDITSYAKTHPPFPHQTTNDQWFDEAQFESYRKLGEHIALRVLGEPLNRACEEGGASRDIRHGGDSKSFNVEKLFTELEKAWRGRVACDPRARNQHTLLLDALNERLRTEEHARYLSREIFPEWPVLLHNVEASDMPELPKDDLALKHGFYLCREAAQLMERVYLDLDLETNHNHPDCRGWMNLFRHWSWSPTFRITWAITAATFGASFQRFARHRLGLDVGEIDVAVEDWTGKSVGALNFAEREMLMPHAAAWQGKDAKLARFDLAVKYGVMNPTELRRFHFGCALIVDGRIVYFRVQDHLRSLGLGRKALEDLMRLVPGLDYVHYVRDQPIVPAREADRLDFEKLYDSVRAGRPTSS
jgi:hypothetical protein